MAVIKLSDGRALAVSVSGPDDAMPLLFHHGTPDRQSRSASCCARPANAG
ncbi:MAG: hypothetical protein ABJA87_05295 [bacterium]